MNDAKRKIIHIDMDAFYAAVEQRDNPALRGKAIAIGSDGARGVLATASYEARKYGVGSAMSSAMAKKRCPHLIFVRPSMEKYRDISMRIREIFSEYTDLVEPLSFDEAYLDVSDNKMSNPSGTLIANEIRQRIWQDLELTASAGVSYNKFLAKVASDVNKPNGIFVIKPEEAIAFIEKLKVERFFGIGKVTAQKMHKMGVFFGSDLKKLSQHRLIQSFGKPGSYYYQIVRGIDNRAVNAHRERKSVGGENTFLTDLALKDDWIRSLEPIVTKVWERLQRSGKLGKTITLKVKYADFTQITRSITLMNPVSNQKLLWEISLDLVNQVYTIESRIRLLGVSVSNFLTEEQEAIQLAIDWKEFR